MPSPRGSFKAVRTAPKLTDVARAFSNSAAGKTLRRQLRLLSDAKQVTMTSQMSRSSKL
jgi:hypothetical protein